MGWALTTLVAAEGVLLRAVPTKHGVSLEEVRPGQRPESIAVVQEDEVEACAVLWAREYGIFLEKKVLALDSETFLITPGCMAPKLVCVSAADEDDQVLVHAKEARELVVSALESDRILTGHYLAYDMGVFANEWPDLLPLIFEVYAADRISDTGIREKLQHIAMGIYRRFERSDGDWVHLEYSLEAVANRRLGVQLEKGGWQLRFGELYDTPVAWWPEDAKQYALGDAVAAYEVRKNQNEEGREYLEDEYRQSRAEWWLRLMSCWGMHVDIHGVREFARITQQKYDAIADDLVAAGLLRRVVKKKTGEFVKYTRNVKAVRARVEQVYTKLKRVVPKSEKENIQTDSDTCERSKDATLIKYATLSSLSKTLSTDIPLLSGDKRGGIHIPLQARFETLLETGRTSSSPNVQNPPTAVGVRECFIPRPGYVFAAADFSGFELRTWAQFCTSMGWESKMAAALNAGRDPHLEMAANILHMSYEDAKRDFKANPLGEVYKARQSAKVCDFGFPGGLGYARFVEFARSNYGVIITEDEAKELKEHWRTSWPESVPFFEWVGKQCDAPVPQLLQLFSNRVRGNLSFTELANSTFQGLAADCAKAAGFVVSRACYAQPESVLYGSRIVNFVHDELLLEIADNEHAADCAEELARLMCEGAAPFLPDVPPVAEPFLMRRWSKLAKAVYVDGRLIPWEDAIDAAENFCRALDRAA